jgi:hypothetical protein
MQKPTLSRTPSLLHAPGLFFLLLLALSGLFHADPPRAVTAPPPTRAPIGLPPRAQMQMPVRLPLRTPAPFPSALLADRAEKAEAAARPQTVLYLPRIFAPEAARPAAPQPTPAPTARPRMTLRWGSIDFSPESGAISADLRVPEGPDGGAFEVSLTIRPGWPCDFWDFRACAGVQDDGQSGVLLVTVHSGLGGDGQGLRHALEGTGFNTAARSLEQIGRRMQQMQGAPVTLRQGDGEEALRVLSVERIPPPALDDYFSRGPLEALRGLAQRSETISEALRSGAPLLVIETCGWRHLEEWGQPGASNSTGSVYLVIMGE